MATEEDANKNKWLKEGQPAGDIMCNLTSQAMGLHYLGVTKPCKDCPEECNQYTQMEDYLECVRRVKIPNMHRGTTATREYLLNLFDNTTYFNKLYGKIFKKDEITKLFKPYLEKGCSIIISSFGHIVRVQAITEEGLVVDDPYGKIADFSKSGVTSKYRCKGKDCRNDKKGKMNNGNNSLWRWEELENNKIILKTYEIYSIEN